jgi:hypothetical protein
VTPLYSKPDVTSRQLAELPSGTLITVSETAGDFLAVLTHDDSFGYLPRTAAMVEVDVESTN